MPKDNLKAKYNFSRPMLDALISSLNQLIKHAQEGTLANRGEGICTSWMNKLLPEQYREMENEQLGCCTTTFSLVAHISADWPGSRTPGKPNSWPIQTDYNYPMWEGSNLAARLSLMRYVAHRLRGWRRRTPA